MTDGNPIDFPNLFVMSCPSDQKPFVTLHFPEKYVFNGFSSDTWLPNTKLAVRVPSGTFSFDAELNRNEFFVDLGESEFDYLQDIWSADGRVDLKVGPAMSDVTLVFAPVEDPTRKMLAKVHREVKSASDFLGMRTRCIASMMAKQSSREWKIFGSVNCTDCPKSDKKTFTFFTVEHRSGSKARLRSADECARAKRGLLATLKEQNEGKGQTMVADLLCIGDGSWQ
jgi:hypothetical protein